MNLMLRNHSRRRQKEGGAIIFVVAMTLSLLAAMGLFAMSTTVSEVQASGYSRQATQTHYVTEFGTMGGVDSFSPETAGFIENSLRQSTTGTTPDALKCRSVKDNTGTAINTLNEVAKRCVRVSPKFLDKKWSTDNGTTVTALPSAMVGLKNGTGEFSAEISEPLSGTMLPGFDTNNGKCFNKYTITTYGDLYSVDTSGNRRSIGHETMRARVVAGPFDCGG